MDTKQVADILGTTPRRIRMFLRSSESTFVAVGSGARYEFTEAELPMLKKRFAAWEAGGKSGSRGTSKAAPAPVAPRPTTGRKRSRPSKKDAAVWAEEGPVQIEDIRNPRVRARVKQEAEAQERRLMALLMSRGMHVYQLGNQRKAS